MDQQTREVMVAFARECIGNLFTRGELTHIVIPTEDIETSINCILAACPKERSLTFVAALESLLNRYSIERWSNTPDYILADYLIRCLLAWDAGVAAREKWYGLR